MLIRIILFGLCLIAAPKFTNEVDPSKDAGFVESVYDVETIQSLLNRRNCDGVRFYNTMKEGKVQLIAVSVSNGADMNTGLFPLKPYVLSMGIMGSRIEVDNLSKNKARDICEAIDLSQFSQYSTFFNKDDLESLFNNANCNALKIVPAMASGKLSMEIRPANFSEGMLTDLGEGEALSLLDTEPCPTVCGSFNNYIYVRE